MFSRLRIALSIVAFVVLILGVVLFYFPGVREISVATNQEQKLCAGTISQLVDPQHTLALNCPVKSGGWFDASVSSKLPAAFQISFIGQGSGTSKILYEQTGPKFSVNFPTFNDGTVAFVVRNLGTTNTTLSGSYVSAIQILVQDAFSQTSFPYRTRGEAVVGVSGLILFILVWNPRMVATRTLDHLSRSLSRKKEPAPVAP